MRILAAPTFPVKSSPRRPRPAKPFGFGIETEEDGSGLTAVERDRVQGARRRAERAYRADMPDASPAEVERVAIVAALDEKRRCLAERSPAEPPALPESFWDEVERANPVPDPLPDPFHFIDPAPCCAAAESHPCRGCAEEVAALDIDAELAEGCREIEEGEDPSAWADWTDAFRWEPTEDPIEPVTASAGSMIPPDDAGPPCVPSDDDSRWWAMVTSAPDRRPIRRRDLGLPTGRLTKHDRALLGH